MVALTSPREFQIHTYYGRRCIAWLLDAGSNPATFTNQYLHIFYMKFIFTTIFYTVFIALANLAISLLVRNFTDSWIVLMIANIVTIALILYFYLKSFKQQHIWKWLLWGVLMSTLLTVWYYCVDLYSMQYLYANWKTFLMFIKENLSYLFLIPVYNTILWCIMEWNKKS